MDNPNEARVAKGADLERLGQHSIRTFATPTGQNVGSTQIAIANAFKFGGAVVARAHKKSVEEDRNTGAMAYLQGISRQELEEQGVGNAGLAAYDGVLAKTAVQRWTAEEINSMASLRSMPVDDMAARQQAKYRELTVGMTPGQRTIANGAWQGHLQSVITAHFAANAAFKREQVIDAFSASIDVKLAAGDIPGAIEANQRMINGTLPGIGREESRTRAVQNMVGQMRQGTDTLYTTMLVQGAKMLGKLTEPQRRQLSTAYKAMKLAKANVANGQFAADMADHRSLLQTLGPIDVTEYANKAVEIMTTHGIPIDADVINKIYADVTTHNAQRTRRLELAAEATAKAEVKKAKSRSEGEVIAARHREEADARKILADEKRARESLSLAVIDQIIAGGIAAGSSEEAITAAVASAGSKMGLDPKLVTLASTHLVKAKTATIKAEHRRARAEATRRERKRESERPAIDAALDGTLYKHTPAEREVAILRVHEGIDQAAKTMFPGDDEASEGKRQAYALRQKMILWNKNNVIDTALRSKFNAQLAISTRDILRKDPVSGDLALPAAVVEALQQYSAMYAVNPRLAMKQITDPDARIWAHAAVSGGPDLLATIQDTVLSKGLDNKETRAVAISAFNSPVGQEALDDALDDAMSGINETSILDWVPFRSRKYEDDQNGSGFWTGNWILFADTKDDADVEAFGPVIRARIRSRAVALKSRNPFMAPSVAADMAANEIMSRSVRVGNTVLYTPRGEKTPEELAGFVGRDKDTMHNVVMKLIPNLIYKAAKDGGFKTNALGIPGNLAKWFASTAIGPEDTDKIFENPRVLAHYKKNMGNTFLTQIESGIAIRLIDNSKNLPAIIITWDMIKQADKDDTERRNKEANEQATKP